MKKENNQDIVYFEKAQKILKDLKKNYPELSTARHITLAFSDYPDMFAISEKEFCFALEKYSAELELDIVPNESIETIIASTEDLFTEIEVEDERSWDNYLDFIDRENNKYGD